MQFDLQILHICEECEYQYAHWFQPSRLLEKQSDNVEIIIKCNSMRDLESIAIQI